MTTLLEPRGLIDSLLEQQQCVTAVEKFAEWHGCDETPSLAPHYRDLIPLSLPKDGEQYAFEVDLDACSGCKACVVACHNLNGLDEHETWRSVGLLHGGTDQLPVVQHVTTACHHCLEPACMSGCPVHAYEKDPQTGIVRHLDDQCIGCQYCILQCPYDVPQYSYSKGIVRKCDMCQGRLSAGEAPACVQSCPNSAIRVTLVSQQLVREESEANLFLPGAPEPGYTLPSTLYKTNRPLPRNLLPADYYSVSPQHAHWPLVFMLVLTQMSVGTFIVEQWLGLFPMPDHPESTSAARTVQCIAAFVLGVIGLGAATLHLGRPQYAFRAFLGLRTSWLSREIVAFGVFALLATCYAALPWIESATEGSLENIRHLLGALVALCGIVGVLCSALIYVSTRRPFWNAPLTFAKFFLTCAMLGLPTALLIWLLAATALGGMPLAELMTSFGARMLCALMGLAVIKLLIEASIFGWLPGTRFTPLKRTALLLAGELGPTTLQRFALGVAGGVILPLTVALPYLQGPAPVQSPVFALCAIGLCVVLLFAGELIERYTFFAAVVAPKMPGAPAS